MTNTSTVLPVLQLMLATTGQPGGDQALWSWECKWDGWRALVYIDGNLRVRTRTGRQVSDSLPELTGVVDALDGHRLILDGELVACVDGAVAVTPHSKERDPPRPGTRGGSTPRTSLVGDHPLHK